VTLLPQTAQQHDNTLFVVYGRGLKNLGDRTACVVAVGVLRLAGAYRACEHLALEGWRLLHQVLERGPLHVVAACRVALFARKSDLVLLVAVRDFRLWK
jgi:hypothetical protein